MKKVTYKWDMVNDVIIVEMRSSRHFKDMIKCFEIVILRKVLCFVKVS